MNGENVGLSRHDTILWIIGMLAAGPEEYDFLMSRLRSLTADDLRLVDVVASSNGFGGADALKHELKTEPDTALILDACAIAPKHDRNHSVSDIKKLIRSLQILEFSRDNLTVHLNASSAYRRVLPAGSVPEYADNFQMIRLVEEHPQRLSALMIFIEERGSMEIPLLSDYLAGAAPLADGTL